jgi:hypothetical protein
MELAISSDERANTVVATDMGIPGPNLKIEKASGRSVTLHLQETTITISTGHITIGTGTNK